MWHESLRHKQVFTLLLSALLGLAIFISPYQLHQSPGSIFFKTFPASAEPLAQHQHHDHDKTQELRCLRCVLYGFQVPETATPFIVILVVLGFLRLPKPSEPFSFIPLSKSARAPPT
jgi:hypothetical protein